MKKSIALVVLALGSQAVAIFAGEPIETSKQVVAPSPVPPPGFFRPNEFDLGAFGTYATGVDENAGSLSAWGGGLDLTYWFPWKYAGARFQGAGINLSGGGGNRNQVGGGQYVGDPYVTLVRGFAPAYVSGGGGSSSVAAGIITGDFTPHIGVFGEASLDIIDGSSNNLVQANFGLKYAF
jgi:hypothetical protein